MDRFFVIINEASPGSWPDLFWSDLKGQAEIFLDNNTLRSERLRKIKKAHFSNIINRKLFLPFKSIWDLSNSLPLNKINPKDRCFVIFQSAVKFSPHYIKKLKKNGAIIILYLPDTVEKLGLAKNKKELRQYESRYYIDKTYSFDPHDSEVYDITFFDIYSSLSHNMSKQHDNGVFYIGNCRTAERLDTLNKIYDRLSRTINCDFRLVGVEDESSVHSGITCNQPLPYSQVLDLIADTNCVLEIMNESQQGNTLRSKEAICFNKRLLTNNANIVNNPYYNPRFIQYFSKPEDIRLDWFEKDVQVDYGYQGEYSPRAFLKLLEKDFE